MAPEKAPAFQFYPKDFLTDRRVLRMPMAARGIYITLLCHAWMDGALPNDLGELALILGVPEKTVAAQWPFVLPCFTERDGSLYQNRIEEEREKQAAYREKQSAKATAKWGESRQETNSRKRSERLAHARSLGQHTAAEWQAMRSAYGRCLRCGAPESQLVGGACVKDHIIPIYVGGSDAIQNLQPMCRNCNSSKGSDQTDYRLTAPETRPEWLPNGAKTPAERLPNACSSSSSSSSSSEIPQPPSGAISRSSALAGMLPRDHLSHAACSPNFAWCVPEAVHVKLAARLAPRHGGDVAAAKVSLIDWYVAVWSTLPEGTVIGDAFKFWGPRFDAVFASAVSQPSKPYHCNHVPPCVDDVAHTQRKMREAREVNA